MAESNEGALLNDIRLKNSTCVEGLKKFLLRTAYWRPEHDLSHVRQLCVEEAIKGIDMWNVPYAMKFGKECRSQEIYDAALEKICRNLEEVSDQSPGFFSLDLIHILEIIKQPKLTVQSEEHLFSVMLHWLANSRYTEVYTDLISRESLEIEIDSIKASVGGLKTASLTIADDVEIFEQEVTAKQDHTDKSFHQLQITEIAVRKNRLDLMQETQKMEKAVRELGGMKIENLFQIYKNPRASLQKLLEALALMIGLDRHWKSTQKICSEGTLIYKMMQFNIHEVTPEKIKGVYTILETFLHTDEAFTGKAPKLIVIWVRSATNCVKLVNIVQNLEKQRNIFESLYEENRSISSSLTNDLNALKLSSKDASAEWMFAEKKIFTLELQWRLCLQRLIRTASRIEWCAAQILKRIKWNLISKDFIIGRICGDPFIANFVLCNGENVKILNAACNIPEASFLHAVGSQELPITWAQKNGRHLRGCARNWDEAMLSRQVHDNAGFTWSRTLFVTELNTYGNLASVGSTKVGSLVSISGDYIYVAGGLDTQRIAQAKVFRARLSPASELLTKDEWVQIAFMNTARAFGCGGIMMSARKWKLRSPISSPRSMHTNSSNFFPLNSPDHTPFKDKHFADCSSPKRHESSDSPGREGRFQPKECMFICGGYSSEGKWLRTVEVVELPWADHWRRIHVLEVPRVLASAVLVKDAMIAVGGFDQHANGINFCERIDVPLGFDTLGQVLVFTRSEQQREYQ